VVPKACVFLGAVGIHECLCMPFWSDCEFLCSVGHDLKI
jgi:hypothetical protein